MATKVTYKINLGTVFDRAYRGKSDDVRRKLRPFIHAPEVKNAVGELAVEKIIDRTESGIDMRGNEFKEYSDSYKDSIVFDIYGKSPSRVNLTLTGEMLASMVHRELSAPEVVLYMSDGFNNDKAHGHMNGIKSKKYGRVKRQFLGLPKDVENEIIVEAILRHAEINLTESLAGASSDNLEIIGDL